MKKFIVVAVVLMFAVSAIPAYALLDKIKDKACDVKEKAVEEGSEVKAPVAGSEVDVPEVAEEAMDDVEGEVEELPEEETAE